MSIEFFDNRIKIKAAIKKAGIAWLHEACGELEAQTKRNSKVLSGKTKGSFQYKVDESSLEGYIGSSSENAIWEEFGTGEYALNGDGRKGGWFYKDASGQGHFTMGKKPRRAFFKAYTSLKTKLKNSAAEKFRGID